MHTFTTAGTGTSCLACTLECVLHSPQLVNYLLDKNCATEDINSRKRNAAALVKEVVALTSQKWGKNDEGFTDLSSVVTALHKYSKGATTNPRDCFEALLQSMHTGLSKISQIPGSLARTTLNQNSLDAWDAAAKAGTYSFLTELFQGQLLRDTNVYEHFWNLTFTGSPEGPGDMLQALLEKHLTGTMVTYAPLLLIIYVDKLAYTATLAVGGDTYSLYAVLYKHPDTSYAAVCEHRGQWTIFKDSTCVPTTENEALDQYRRVCAVCYKKVITATQA